MHGSQGEITVVDVDYLSRLYPIQAAMVIHRYCPIAVGVQVIGEPNDGTFLQSPGFIAFESSYSDSETLQVLHYPNAPPILLIYLSNKVYPVKMLVGGAVREIQSDHVQAGCHHLPQDRIITAGRSQRGDDLCSGHFIQIPLT
jgi:hypothetical protein